MTPRRCTSYPATPTRGDTDQVRRWPCRITVWVGVSLGVGEMGVGTFGAPHPHEPVVSDAVAPGELEVRRGDEVRASDAEVDTIQGLVVDPATIP
jgi:hypothetical protein